MIASTTWQKYRLPLLLLLLFVGWFLALDVMALRGEEPRRALVAWEMWQSGNYLQPTIQGEPYYNKPPLFNWLIAGFYQLFGSENWVVRLPSLLAYVLWGYVNFRVVRSYVNRNTALYSTLFFFTAAHYLFFGTVLAGELDLLYGFIVYLQGITIFHFFRRRKWFALFLVSYLLVSVGFMTKGLPSIAYQGLTFIGLAVFGHWIFSAIPALGMKGENSVIDKVPLWDGGDFRPQILRSHHTGSSKESKKSTALKVPFGVPQVGSDLATLKSQKINLQLRWLFNWQHVLGAIIGLAPVVCYFWYYNQQHGNGLLYLYNLVEEASQKSVTEGKFLDIIKHLVELPFQFLIDHLPWVLLLPYGIWKGWHKEIFTNDFLRYCLLFFGINVLLYWVSPGTRIRYFYGLVPFFFIPLAYWLDKYRPVKLKVIWTVLFILAGARIAYNYTVLPYQTQTIGTVLLYNRITDDALKHAAGKPLYTCCQQGTILVDPSIAGLTLLRDTILIPMYTPYQIPFMLQRERGQIVPFLSRPDRPGIYLSTDTNTGKLLETYTVWNDEVLYLFEVN